MHYSDITWAFWCLKSLTAWLFVLTTYSADNKEHNKYQYYSPFVTANYRWLAVPLKKGQLCETHFLAMTSSCAWPIQSNTMENTLPFKFVTHLYLMWQHILVYGRESVTKEFQHDRRKATIRYINNIKPSPWCYHELTCISISEEILYQSE